MGPWQVLLVIAFWLVPIFLAQKIASSKGRTGWPWGLLLGWIGVIITACLSPSAEHKLAQQAQIAAYRQPPASPLEGKTCPDCAETVQPTARVCRFCGHRFEPETALEPSPGSDKQHGP